MSKNHTHGSVLYRLRRGLSGILCLALLLGLLPAGTVLSARAASWAQPYAQQLVDWGVMRGDVSGNLNLDSAITRAEFVTLINRAYGYDKVGPTPFTDVSSRDWYYQDIGIAYNIGYFKGTSATIASPRGTLTREQAAVLLSRNLMLQETVGETLGFSDSRTLSDWSRGLIGAAVAEGMISGYSDGSFQPKRNITRGEVAAMLVRAIGTPIQKSGDYSLGSVYGNVTINESGVNLRDTVIVGNLYLTGGIDLGDVLLENVKVLGRIVISGGGESNASQSSVVLRNVEANELNVDSIDGQFVTIRAEGTTDIPVTNVRTNAYLDDSSWPGYGLSLIKLDGEEGTKLQLAGNVKEVRNLTPSSDLQVVQGTAEKITVDEYAKNSTLLVDVGTRIDELNLDVATRVTGDGDIKKLNIGAAGCNVAILPDEVNIRPGITATIDGEEMNSATAAELSAEPKLLAGYPSVKNIAPTTATGVFSTNKAGTVYWAISAVADGSVSIADLLENPAYGGNIYEKQAGSINASSSNKEFTSSISKLLPDGSYYISAIMVDGRGRQSPLKVAAFTTPDNTVPAFNKPYPMMTKNTTDVAQVTVMTNKSCQLYYALLPSGSTTPTPQEFKTNSISGNLGYGVVDAVKNTTMPIKVNRGTLQEKTSYDLYLWLTDYNGANSSSVVKLAFTTPDETPPIVTSIMQTQYAANSAQVTATLNEPGTIYWAIVTEAVHEDGSFMNYELDSLEAKVKVESGAGALNKGSGSASRAEADIRLAISGLNTNTTHTTSYILYYVAKDRDGNYSESVGTYKVRTLDTVPPTVTQEFTSYNGDKKDEPLSDTDIRLVFSETVKGSAKEGDLSFLELYNAVQAAVADNDARAIEDARNALRDALASHITLYSVPRSGRETPVTERNGSNPDAKDWTIDWRYAEVSMDTTTGAMIVTLPTVNEETNTMQRSALNLESGATYYFRFEGIYDTAINPNLMGNTNLPAFTTVYAQVSLSESDESTTGNGGSSPNIRLDMCLNVEPITTNKVADTECWDMIMWSDTSVQLQLYRRERVGSNGAWSDWELINDNGKGTPAAITVVSGQDFSGISLTGTVEQNSNQAVFRSLKQDLLEDHTYQYGIHFTQVGDLSEAEYESWSNLVTMRFAIIAGGANGLGTIANNVNRNYENMADYNVKSIGTAYSSTGMTDILTLRRQFTDRSVPSFTMGSPLFTAGSSAIHMELALDREGTIYYVVAPADGEGAITTSVGTGTSAIFIDRLSDSVKDTALTYIPLDGRDRETSSPYIAYLAGEGYSAPTYLNIVNPRYDKNVVKSGSVPFIGSTRGVDVTGLKPSTKDKEQWYYIYFVLQGGGDVYSKVQCYKVKMEELSTPSITVNGTGSTVSLMPDAETEITYAMWEYNSLPDAIRNDTVNFVDPDTSSNMTVLKAIITPLNGSDGETYFDRYATSSQKNTVVQYIIGSTTGGISSTQVGSWKIPNTGNAAGAVNHPANAQAFEQITVPFDDRVMTSPTSEYVVLAAARNVYGGKEGIDYGFGGVRALSTPDKVPPEFDMSTAYPKNGQTTGEKYLQPSFTTMPSAPDNLLTAKFSGSVSVEFTKELYYHQNADGRLYQVWANAPTGNNTSIAKSFAQVCGGTAVTNNHVTFSSTSSGVTSSVTVNFTNIQHGETITFFGGGSIANRSDFSAGKTLTLTFDATLRTTDYRPDYNGLDMSYPGFIVSWG